MKTAMNQLRDKLQELKNAKPLKAGIISLCIALVDEQIEVEKQQIKDAFNNSSSDTFSNNIPKYKDAEQYYQTTFKTKE